MKRSSRERSGLLLSLEEISLWDMGDGHVVKIVSFHASGSRTVAP